MKTDDLDKLQEDWSRYVIRAGALPAASQAVVADVDSLPGALASRAECQVGRRPRRSSLRRPSARKTGGTSKILGDRITDKAGARAIVQLEGHIDQLAAAIEAAGTLPLADEPQDSRKGDPQQFDYRGLHLQVFAPSEPDDTERIECELHFAQRHKTCGRQWSRIGCTSRSSRSPMRSSGPETDLVAADRAVR